VLIWKRDWYDWGKLGDADRPERVCDITGMLNDDEV
jgi:hypothetical protein